MIHTYIYIHQPVQKLILFMAMTKNPSSCVLLVAIVLVSAASIGHAQDDATVGIWLGGTLYCTRTGNRMNGVPSRGADGVNVTLSCGLGRNSTIATIVSPIVKECSTSRPQPLLKLLATPLEVNVKWWRVSLLSIPLADVCLHSENLWPKSMLQA